MIGLCNKYGHFKCSIMIIMFSHLYMYLNVNNIDFYKFNFQYISLQITMSKAAEKANDTPFNDTADNDDKVSTTSSYKKLTSNLR